MTYAVQTHPADGNAGMLMGSADAAAGLCGGHAVAIQVLSFGEGRAEKAHMGMAPVPAAQRALSAAGLAIDDMAAVKTHNPLAVNDLYFAAETGFAAERMNHYGSSLIYGHPQGPTGLRQIIEPIGELVLPGGGYACSPALQPATRGAAIVIRVDDR